MRIPPSEGAYYSRLYPYTDTTIVPDYIPASPTDSTTRGPRTMHTDTFFFEFTQTGCDETVNIYLLSRETVQKSQ